MKLLTLPAVLLCAVLPAFSDSFNVFVAQPVPPFHILMDPNGNPLLQQSFRDGGSNILEFFVDLRDQEITNIFYLQEVPMFYMTGCGASFSISSRKVFMNTSTTPGCLPVIRLPST